MKIRRSNIRSPEKNVFRSYENQPMPIDYLIKQSEKTKITLINYLAL
jgi:hypothetical protein